MTDSTSNTGVKMVRDISTAVSDVKESASVMGSHTADRLDAIRETVAGTLDETSAAIQDGGKQMSEIADAAAQKVKTGRSMFARPK